MDYFFVVGSVILIYFYSQAFKRKYHFEKSEILLEMKATLGSRIFCYGTIGIMVLLVFVTLTNFISDPNTDINSIMKLIFFVILGGGQVINLPSRFIVTHAGVYSMGIIPYSIQAFMWNRIDSGVLDKKNVLKINVKHGKSEGVIRAYVGDNREEALSVLGKKFTIKEL